VSVIATLDGQVVEHEQVIALSELENGAHIFKVEAADWAGNAVEEEVVFEVRSVPAMIHFKPHKWDLHWIDPFDHGDTKGVTAYISLENVEVETILPTSSDRKLKIGDRFGDFVVEGVVVAQDYTLPHGAHRIRSVTLKYISADQVDILAFSGNTTWDLQMK